MMCEQCVTRPPWDVEEGVLVQVQGTSETMIPADQLLNVTADAATPLNSYSSRELDIDT